MAKELSVLQQQAEAIKNETNKGANTADRIGGMFGDMLDYNEEKLTEFSSNTDEKFTELNKNTGIYDIDEFSTEYEYSIGEIVSYNGLLYEFIANHSAGEWNSEEVSRYTLKKSLNQLIDTFNIISSDSFNIDVFCLTGTQISVNVKNISSKNGFINVYYTDKNGKKHIIGSKLINAGESYDYISTLDFEAYSILIDNLNTINAKISIKYDSIRDSLQNISDNINKAKTDLQELNDKAFVGSRFFDIFDYEQTKAIRAVYVDGLTYEDCIGIINIFEDGTCRLYYVDEQGVNKGEGNKIGDSVVIYTIGNIVLSKCSNNDNSINIYILVDLAMCQKINETTSNRLSELAFEQSDEILQFIQLSLSNVDYYSVNGFLTKRIGYQFVGSDPVYNSGTTYISEKIPVKQGDKITYSGSFTNSCVIGLKENEESISLLGTGTYINEVIVIPEEVVYVRGISKQYLQDINDIHKLPQNYNEIKSDKEVYSLEDLMKGRYYSINTEQKLLPQNYYGMDVWDCMWLEVKKGDIVYLTTLGGNNARAYILVKEDGTIYNSASELADLHNEKIIIENDGYLYVNYNNNDSVKKAFRCEIIRSKQEISSLYNGYPIPKNPTQLKVLMLGNSFSNLPSSTIERWLIALGIENVTWGLAVYAGCSLEKYYNDYINDTASFDFKLCDTYSDRGAQESAQFKTYNAATREEVEDGTLVSKVKDILSYEDWDIVTLQQQSNISGIFTTMEPYIEGLIKAIKENCPNAGVKIAWHQTWAYANGFNSSDRLGQYNNSQKTMHNMIINCSKKMKELYGIDLIIPNAVMIKYLRELPNSTWGESLSTIKGGDTYVSGEISDFTYDGLHLTNYANLAAFGTIAQSTICAVFNKSIKNTNVTYLQCTEENNQYIRDAVLHAISNPFELYDL